MVLIATNYKGNIRNICMKKIVVKYLNTKLLLLPNWKILL